MTIKPSRLLSLDGREPSQAAIRDPSSAQFQLWLAQAQRDHGNFGAHEYSKFEGAVAPLASRSRVIFNPFTGEVRKVEF